METNKFFRYSGDVISKVKTKIHDLFMQKDNWHYKKLLIYIYAKLNKRLRKNRDIIKSFYIKNIINI